MKVMQAIKTLVSPEIASKPAGPLPDAEPLVHTTTVTAAIAIACVKDAGLLTKEVQDYFLKGVKIINDARPDGKNVSRFDGHRQFVRLMEQAISSGDHSKIVSERQIQENTTVVRQAMKRRAAELSQVYLLRAADIFEASLAHCPKFVDGLLKAEAAVLPSIYQRLPGSPLRNLLNDLPRFIKAHATQLRNKAEHAVVVNPGHLFNLIP